MEHGQLPVVGNLDLMKHLTPNSTMAIWKHETHMQWHLPLIILVDNFQTDYVESFIMVLDFGVSG